VIELAVTLTDEQLEQLAARVAELLPATVQAPPESLLTVDALAELLGTSPDWVRRHQAQLGAFRLSEGGGRNPIRFRASNVERFLAERRLTPPARASWREDPDWALG
jgi:hypothetical protein